MFLDDEAEAFSGREEESLLEVIQEILTRHCEGIHYKERSAGADLDVCLVGLY